VPAILAVESHIFLVRKIDFLQMLCMVKLSHGL